jgi:GH24 family phage-related lysozyme (muramidase)
MAAINPTNNTGLIVDEFISYATNHLNSVEGVISTVSLYAAGPPPSPIQVPGPGIINWKGYFISPSTKSTIVTQDDFKPKEDVEDHNSARPTKEENIQTGTTEEEIDKKIEEEGDFSVLDIEESDIQTGEIKFNQGKPFVTGFKGGGGGGFSSGFSGAVSVDLGDLDLSADWITIAAKFIGKNEGFTERATWDVNAYRLGFGTENIIGSDGKVRKVLPDPSYYKQTGEKVPANGDTTTVEAALKMLQYEVSTTFKNRLVGNFDYQIPEATFNSLNDRQKAALISYVYNVGSLRVGIATALKAGNLSSAVAQIQAGPVTPEKYRVGLQRRRNEEASLFSA